MAVIVFYRHICVYMGSGLGFRACALACACLPLWFRNFDFEFLYTSEREIFLVCILVIYSDPLPLF